MPVIKSENIPSSATTFSMKDIENQARALMMRARQQSEALIAAAQAEAELLRQQGKADGLKEGKAAGMAQGLAEGKKTGHDAALAEHRVNLTSLVKTLTAAAAQFESGRNDLEAAGLREVIALASSIARRVTKRQGLIEPSVMEANLHEAMKLVAHAADVRIFVHPSQLHVLSDTLPRLQLQWPSMKHVELSEDAKIAPGGVRIATQGGIVDGDLDVQLDRVIDTLLPKEDLS